MLKLGWGWGLSEHPREANTLHLTRTIITSGDIKARTVTTRFDKSAALAKTISSIHAKVVTRVNTKAKVAPTPMFKQAFIGTEGETAGCLVFTGRQQIWYGT
jgi:hypothetical protein